MTRRIQEGKENGQYIQQVEAILNKDCSPFVTFTSHSTWSSSPHASQPAFKY
jgi:hypothetical protein